MLTSIFTDAVTQQIFCIVLWVALFIITLGIELSTTQLVSIWFTGGSLVSLILAICNVGFIWQVVVWAVSSGILLLISKFIFKKKIEVRSTKTNTDSLVGEEILIISKVAKEHNGEGKIRDVVWTVVTNDELPIEEGEFAIVKKIEGNRLYVSRKER